MYLEYYSLDRPPFRITPDPSLFYTGGANGRGVVLEALLYAVTSGEGILKVVGEVGSGKTMLCRMLEERLPDSVEVVYLANPNLSAHEILYAIAFELKLPVDHATQRLVLMQHLQEYLLRQHAINRSVLVIIEEAQSMPLATLEEVRLFSNLETHQHKLMQIVLFGQPELDKNLQDKSIRQLRERITHSFDLRPLNAEEVSDYIRFRLQAAGCPAPQVFSSAAEKLIAKASGGLTRRINILADKAMLSAYAESATGQRPRTIDNQLQPAVLPKHVKAAISDSGYRPNVFTWPRVVLASLTVLTLIVFAGWWHLAGQNAELTAQLQESAAANAAQRAANVELLVSPTPISPSNTNTAAPTTNAVEESVEVIEFEQESELQGSLLEAPVQVASSTQVERERLVPREVTPTTPIESESSPAAQAVSESSVELNSSIAQNFSDLPVLLRERSEAMQRWLVNVNPQSYTLQILSISSNEIDDVGRVLRRLQQADLLDNTYTCLFGNQTQEYWKVVYGDFATAAQARAVISELPANIRSNGPFVQRIQRLDCTDAMGVN